MAIQLASRVVCVLLLIYAFDSIISIPSLLTGVEHYKTFGDRTGPDSAYWLKKYLAWVGSSLLRAAVGFWLAKAFYRCDARVIRFFVGDPLQTTEGVEGTA